jgi:DHA1 family inner membrane transport protein
MTESARFPLFRLLVLAGAIFVSVTSEFLPTGLLPDMAEELGVSESQIGLLITTFAFTVVISTTPLTLLTRNFSRKWLMVLLLGVFAIANLLCAVAPTYEVLLVARILGGLAHGLFWAVTGPYAARLVPRHQLARAISVTNAGGTLAFILGVPLGTALGHALGWRLAFAAMAVVVVVFALLVVIFLPPVQHRVALATGEIPLPARRDRTVPAVIIVCITVVLLITGHNVFYTYIAPWAIQIGGVPQGDIGWLLFVYGAAGAVGLLLGGLFGDRFPRGAVTVAMSGLIASVAALGALGTTPVAVVAGMVAWSIFFGGLPALMHHRVLHSASERIRDIAAASLTTAFNLAIGGGALIGGILLDRLGIAVLPWAAAAILSVGLVFTLVTDRRRIAVHPG